MNDDFFSSVPFSGQQSTTSEPIDSFAHAIAARFGSSDLLTARLLPGDPTPSSSSLLHPSSAVPLPAPPHAAAPSGPFTPVAPSGLHAYLSDPATLILDIRPHAAHASARVHRALSLSVPSTLLKRPLFSLQKLSQMLPSQSARTRFSSWSHAARILVYDADSASVPESSNIYGLLRKFANEGFRGELAWLRGGFQAVWREARSLATTDSPSPEDEDEDNTTNTTALRTKLLPKAAFSLSSTTSSRPQSTLALALPTPGPSTSRPANPFFDTIRQNIELSQGITERIPLRLPRRVRRRVADLPFRWLQHIANRSAVRPATDTLTSESESSDDAFDPDPSDGDADVEEGAEALAMQFYRIELAEQRRLLTVMEHHSKQEEQSPVAFPFSITAGVEKGAKNRYTHIWPFEHARPSDEDDYVNASYVQPLGTKKKYIATQGPLPATFVDFWSLCWEQNVHVIVMLTREIENAMVKCGTYWTDTAYGPLRLSLVSTSPPLSPSSNATTANDNKGFFFAPRGAAGGSGSGNGKGKEAGKPPPSTIKRIFTLSHTSYPNVPPRRITHLQYLDWPDMNVPEDPRGVLGLVREVERAVEESTPGPSPGGGTPENMSDEDGTGSGSGDGGRSGKLDPKTGVAKFALGKKSPVLLHCSAGVGRTGGFIAVDAVLDAVRNEMRKKKEARVARKAGVSSGGALMKQHATQHQNTAMPGTVPLHVSAGEKKRRAHHHHQGGDAQQTGASSDSLVVHVPLAGTANPDAAAQPPTPAVDSSAGVGSTSTRQWAEQVSDQIGGRGVESGSGSVSVSASGMSGSGSAAPPSSRAFSISHSTSGSISASNSGSGTGTTSASGSGMLASESSGMMNFMRSRLRESSVTSLSNMSSDSSSEQRKPHKPHVTHAPLRHPAAVYVTSDDDAAMDIDRPPPRSNSVPLQQRTGAAADPNTASQAPTVPAEPDHRTAGHSMIDYKLPRELHTDLSPPLLSSYADPIWTVVQDMREQRMSLCQSLRQYVFVHAAVIEGALQMVDEERELWGGNTPSDESPEETEESDSASSSSGGQRPTSSSSSSPSKGKRGASPTELLKEDKSGEVSLSKRPSFKRKPPSSENTFVGFAMPVGGDEAGSGNQPMVGSMALEGGPSGTAK
ncbi:hypothetical protein BJ138DRAFT_1017757 [Hygrophoropsis aurantiaca]|uniref:Uncharacterized protein n=1 Tax=Hygrophoropsis aurantiaca TaxID=72124 RepID=A0ACB7ZXI0_9AGAM|nr:hypothetical protein BJ138DRAFT_1017757 [Hygrophoropsis aurantiaca]